MRVTAAIGLPGAAPPQLARFFEQRSARISEGRARAKADSSPERPIPLVAGNGK